MKSFEKFYVFYDRNDFVRFCGTAKDLVSGGYFKSINAVHATVAHINQGARTGTVAVLVGIGKEERYCLIKGRKPKYERKEAYTRTAKNHKRARTISNRLACGKEHSNGDASCT